MSDKTDRVSSEALDLIQKRSQLQIGDILFSGTGTLGKTALVSAKDFSWNIKEGVYALTVDSKKTLPRFLIHLLNSSHCRSQIERFADGGTVKSISMKSLKQLCIPLPPLEEQKRIADILDQMDALVNDLSTGLPAELEARRKQYAYYRDRLLTFPELPATNPS